MKIKLLILSCLVCVASIFAQNSPTYNEPTGKLKAFLERSKLTYFEEVHGDLLNNAEITMPIFEGCPSNCNTPITCQCSQWTASHFITEHLSYPDDGYKAGWVGDIRVEYTIDEQGKVQDVEVTNCESAGLSQQIAAAVAQMPKWTPAIVAKQPTALRIYSSFGFFMDTPREVSLQPFFNWGNTNLVLKSSDNQLELTEEQLAAIKNEPMLFMVGEDELAVQTGNLFFQLPKQDKPLRMDADETLDSSRTDKISAFIDAYVTKGTTIKFSGLQVFNPNSGTTIDLPELTLKIK